MSTIYFCSHQAKNYVTEKWRHIFSQWYIASDPFIGKKEKLPYDLKNYIDDKIWDTYVENKKFYLREQWMMALKALVFSNNDGNNNNFEILNQIMATTDAKTIKDLGRKIEGFDETIWNKCKYEIVANGNYLQFTQNKEMEKILLDTYGRDIAEASSYDRVWGIGYNEINATKVNRSKWGQNLLGKAIMQVRERILLNTHYEK